MTNLTRDEVLGALRGRVEREEDPATIEARAKAKLALAEVEGRQQFFDLRNKWSRYIAFWITFLIGFNTLLTYLVGSGCLKFD